MTYPPGHSGGYPPPGSYPPGPPPERSPWSSPAVVVAVVAGVLILIAGVVGALILIPDSDDDNAGNSSSASTVTSTVTTGASTSNATTSTTTTTTTTSSAPARQTPTVPGTDALGFVDGPRCNAPEDQIVMAGQTTRSRLIICQVGTQTGRWYYKGLAPEGGIEIAYPTRSGEEFIVRNGPVTYTISSSSLVITENGATIADETMIEYWAAS